MAVWNRPWYIVAPLVVIILGHFGILLHGKTTLPHVPTYPNSREMLAVTISGTWITGKGCVTTYADGPVLMATYIYTMIFDFIICSLLSIKLLMKTPGAPSRLRNLIFSDGLIYFAIV